MDYLIVLINHESLYQWLTKTSFKILVISQDQNYGWYPSDRLCFSNEPLTKAINNCTFNFNFIIKITGQYFLPELQFFLKNLEINDFKLLRHFEENRYDILGVIKEYSYLLESFDQNVFLNKIVVLPNLKMECYSNEL
jgi:hypothetical protein